MLPWMMNICSFYPQEQQLLIVGDVRGSIEVTFNHYSIV